ncbi:PH domain-containing protein [Sutcliffiella rhizosphaerae]|uniref:Uncharacterized protein YyaB-like PH domain-containing protein n=1 Tax=Sutcliffiella rhizosphaerae TaxID=2880967 RepID=A0ABM8YKC3_9BACI|nr:PH domain-containing protein [Sutcliffiella rhizosphaerae]CAG9620388.1 hypothetical protein BACCIP111883_01156 [Sutcliffiella rhizosphaerae]
MFFSSKKDFFCSLIIWGGSAVLIAFYLAGAAATKDALLTSALILLLMWLWFGTGYKVKDGQIKVYFGPYRTTVNINEITKIEKVNNPFTAPALSMSRLSIMYGKYKTIELSPKDKEEFINVLLHENPSIKFD